MNNTASITRRTALAAAAVSTVALAAPVAAAVKPNTIDELAMQFRDDAMKLDPRIEECWVGYDELADGPRDMRVMHVYFVRKGTPFVSPARTHARTITDLFDDWKIERADRTGETEEQSASRFLRYEELQRKITALRPRSARELAMQFVVETDDGESDFRPEFLERLRHMALGA